MESHRQQYRERKCWAQGFWRVLQDQVSKIGREDQWETKEKVPVVHKVLSKSTENPKQEGFFEQNLK